MHVTHPVISLLVCRPQLVQASGFACISFGKSLCLGEAILPGNPSRAHLSFHGICNRLGSAMIAGLLQLTEPALDHRKRSASELP